MAQPTVQKTVAASRVRPKPSRVTFESTVFDSTLRGLLGDEVLRKARQLQQSEAFQRTLCDHFFVSDAPADRLARAIRADRRMARALDRALRHDLPDSEVVAPELAAFIESAVNIPAFIDRDKVREGGRVFRAKLDLFGLITYGFPIGIYLQGMVPAITMALLFTNRPTKSPASIEAVLARRESKQRGFVRVLETFRWFNAVAESGAGELYSEEFAENCRIRLVHAHIRAAIRGHTQAWAYEPSIGWDEDALGVPMSAADGSIVVSTIVVTLLAMRRHLRKHITEEEMEALNHWANYVSFLQGVPEALLCPHYDDTVVQFAAFIRSMDTDACHSQLVSFMGALQGLGLGQGVMRRFKGLGRMMDGVQAAALDQVFAADVKARFGIRPAAPWAKALHWGLSGAVSLVNRVAGASATVNGALDRQTVSLWRTVIPKAERMLSRAHGKVVG